MQASSAPLQPSVRWSFQVFSNLSLEQPVQFKHATMQPGSGHFAQTKLKVRVLAWNAWNVSPVNPVSFFLKLPGNHPRSGTAAYISIPNLSVPGWLLSRRLWISEKFEGDVRGEVRGDLAFDSFLATQKKPLRLGGLEEIELRYHEALKVVLVNPNYSKLVKHFIATWTVSRHTKFRNFLRLHERIWTKKKAWTNQVLHSFGHVFFNDFQISFLLCQQTWGLSPWNLKRPTLNQPESLTRGSFRIPSWLVGIPYKPSLRKRVLLGKGVTTTQHWTFNLLMFIWRCI